MKQQFSPVLVWFVDATALWCWRPCPLRGALWFRIVSTTLLYLGPWLTSKHTSLVRNSPSLEKLNGCDFKRITNGLRTTTYEKRSWRWNCLSCVYSNGQASAIPCAKYFRFALLTSHYNLLAISPQAPSQRGWELWLTWLVISGRQIKYLLDWCSNLDLGNNNWGSLNLSGL